MAWRDKYESDSERVRKVIRRRPLGAETTAGALSDETGVPAKRINQILHRATRSSANPDGLVERVRVGVYRVADMTQPPSVGCSSGVPAAITTSQTANSTSLRALAECCRILDGLPTDKDRQAVVEALSTMVALSKEAMRGPSDLDRDDARASEAQP